MVGLDLTHHILRGKMSFLELEKFSDADLANELKRRGAKPAKPYPVDNMDFFTVIESCKAYIEQLDLEGHADEDFPHYIFEAAMEAVYGKGIFDRYINRRIQ